MTLKVGITGGIGSGKTTVCRVAEALGYPVYYADTEAKRITETNSDVVSAISALFGGDIYTSGKLNRQRLASIVFGNKELLGRLNSIVHPPVAKDFTVWVGTLHSPIAFMEAAVLFESGLHQLLDKTIVVTAPYGTRVARVVARDGLTPDGVKARMANQAAQDKLVRLADFAINNDGTQPVVPQLLGIIEKLNPQ